MKRRKIVTALASLLLCAFTHGNPSTVPTVQWTNLPPTGSACGVGNNSCIVKVSSSAGNDGTCAATSPPIDNSTDALACLTVAHAVTLLRDGKPDYLLLKKGDTFTNDKPGKLAISGISSSQPIVIDAYGLSLTLPVEQVNAANGSVSSPCVGGGASNKGDFIAVRNIEWYAFTRDPGNGSFSFADATAGNNECFVWQNPIFTWLLFEGNRVRFFNTQFDIDTNSGQEPAPPPLATATLIMNGNVIVDAYPANYNTHSQGAFISGVGSVQLTFNTLDHNGYNATLPGPYSASMTCASPSVVTVTASPFAFAAGSAITLNGTPCGNFSTNTIYCVFNVAGNTFNLTAAAAYTVTPFPPPCPNGTTTINGTASSSGLTVTNNDFQAQIFNRDIYTNGSPTVALNNIFSNSSSEGVQFRAGGGPITNNLYFGNGQCFTMGDGISGAVAGVASNNVCMNSVDIVQGTGNLVRGQGIGIIQGKSGLQLTANVIAHVTNQGVNSVGISIDAPSANVNASPNNVVCWPVASIQDLGTGDTIAPNVSTTSNTCAGQGLSDPTRTVATYDSIILGGPGTLAHFTACARANTKDNWNPLCAAPNVNAWVRPGYGLPP